MHPRRLPGPVSSTTCSRAMAVNTPVDRRSRPNAAYSVSVTEPSAARPLTPSKDAASEATASEMAAAAPSVSRARSWSTASLSRMAVTTVAPCAEQEHGHHSAHAGDPLPPGRGSDAPAGSVPAHPPWQHAPRPGPPEGALRGVKGGAGPSPGWVGTLGRLKGDLVHDHHRRRRRCRAGTRSSWWSWETTTHPERPWAAPTGSGTWTPPGRPRGARSGT